MNKTLILAGLLVLSGFGCCPKHKEAGAEDKPQQSNWSMIETWSWNDRWGYKYIVRTERMNVAGGFIIRTLASKPGGSSAITSSMVFVPNEK